MDKKPKLYLLNGPLGAGKTTVLRYLLRQPEFAHARVIENEFASVSIDTATLHEHVEEVETIAGLCICCSSGDELTEALLALAENNRPVIIEATGVANSLKLIEKLVVADIFSHYDMGRAIFVIDGAEFDADALAMYADELRAADTVLVSKLDLLDDRQRQFIDSAMHDHGIEYAPARNGEFVMAGFAEPSKILDFFADFDGEIATRDEDTSYTIIDIDQPIDQASLQNAWPHLSRDYKLKRIKGDFVDADDNWFHVEATPKQCLIEPTTATKAQIVCIGHDARSLSQAKFMELVR